MGLLNLHSNHKAHGDLSPYNIMLSNAGILRLIDFGQCWELDNPDKGDTTVGTSGYQSPEVLERMGYDHKVDVFAFGLIAYDTYYGKQFCSSELSLFITIEKLKNRIHQFESKHINNSKERMFRTFLRQCLMFISDNRLEVLELIQDPYFMQVHDLYLNKNLMTVCREKLNILIQP